MATIPAVDIILALLGIKLITNGKRASAKRSNLEPNCCERYLKEILKYIYI